MSQINSSQSDGDERYSALINNAAAVRAICSAVEGTLGPKGLDTMLVSELGDVLITNDGATILEQMDVTHPAAKLVVQVARSQQRHVGDGTTTATVLAGAMVAEGLSEVSRGVPVAKVVAGIQEGIGQAVQFMRSRSRPVLGADDPMLYRIAYVAGRENRELADQIIEAMNIVGQETLGSEQFRFSESVITADGGSSEVWPGILLNKQPSMFLPVKDLLSAKILVLQDALEPEQMEEEALTTEMGYKAYSERKEKFLQQLEQLSALNVGLIAVDRGAHAEAEQFCADRGILLLTRVPRNDLLKLSRYTGARPLRRSGLNKSPEDLVASLGFAGQIRYDERIQKVKVGEGAGQPAVTIVVGGTTKEVVSERARIAKDAASAVQAAIRSGYVAGGGAIEIAAARELDRYGETVRGMEGFGISAVARALRKPMAQIVTNAGFNPLEKVEQVKAVQLESDTDSIAVDCDTGQLMDCFKSEVVDPTYVKIQAIQAAGEVASAVLRIHTVVKMKKGYSADE
ncbi:TCP-1/cpn60 chaperonin family protein [Paenibacillus senegalensis]|uniref:TCP-1/cpn60 chaperonin family protein n=1 Tax=Paenibacillus senegalensis TaxID=1465766 RepID=UPI0002894F65|nr:TCP-1/cpn60 chaperonin family protein [Paenibacillus senegalensis]